VIKIFVFLMALFFTQESFGQLMQPDWSSARGDAAQDIQSFSGSLGENFISERTLIPNFVPIEARIGVMFMAALTDVISALYIAVIPFLNVLIIALLMFWFFMETWVMMKSGDGNWLDFGKRVAIRIAKASFWIWIINNNPGDIFMWLMAPLIAVGTIVANTILNGAANIIGTNLPDTCAAIHQWLAGRDDLLISSSQAADLICLPTRPLGFLYTAVWAGFTWMFSGLLQFNPLMVIIGLVFVILFIYNIFTFALRAISVIMDLFFILMFLPFTAMREAVGEDTKYEGPGVEVWKAFVGFIKGASFVAQIERFAKVIIYFILLSIVASLSIAILSTVNLFEFGNFFTILVVGCLVAYLLSKATTDKIKQDFMVDDSFGTELYNQVKGFAIAVAAKAKATWGLIQKARGKGAPPPATP